MPVRFFLALPAGALAACVLAGCGPGPADEPPRGEVVARVNGEEISVRQLNERMALAGMAPEGSPGSARKQFLDELINERLLVQKAMAAGLDRQPQTRLAIEQARAQLLARAAVEAPSADEAVGEREVRQFFEANPDLFADRKVYTFRRFGVEGRVDRATRARLDAAHTPAAVAETLKRAGLAHSLVTETVAAEALAPAVLARAARMQAGDILLLAEGSRTVLMQLAGSIREPLALAAASPSIEDYLAGARHRQRVDLVVRDLRRKAKIEYVTQTASSAKSTALADGKPVLDEPPLQKPIQSRQMTVVR
jgi:EpsD family peptidyl-prolyl cis-trans isomerase